ncbi:hypothetical protein SAMN05444007_108251 [Cribrihabitans marinus]|uniref:Uncharacterized protein n=1 Tax=Cribrihabitans marinus TaxID=1227549 RepID=A0A1H7CST3_9RHOB|nr:hypothetical protein [Cribrihabitans marinus]GGH36341.1 hypothetical protein GCM10010973_30220 [Cribrihabitans marinus]SEJ91637.1 hypothetical protein SAMN05444007_108251 [Cribrihabitans marinus]
MAIVEGKSDLIHDYLDDASVAPDPVQARGRLIVATGTVTNAADDSNTSMYHLVDLPSDCILQPGTFFDVENDGFAQIVIGTRSDSDALIDQTKATENTITPIANGDANHGKRLWEVLGLAEDPGGMIALWKHAEADATGAGNMPFAIHYLHH